MFEAKLRKVGTSIGLLVPKEIIEQEHLKIGKTVEVAIVKKNLALLKEAFGSAKGAGPFERDHTDREF